MSIVTDSFISIYDGGTEVSKIGISSRLGNYSLQEIYDSAYCGQRDKLRVNNILGTEGDVSYLDGNQYFPYPSTTEPAEYTWNWKEGGPVSGYTDPNGLFGRIIWLHSRIGYFDDTITEDNINNYEIVTSWTVNNFVFTLPSISQVHFDNSILPSNWNDNKTFPTMYYAPGAGSLDYHTHLGYPDDNVINVTDIRPYVITQCASCWFVYLLDQSENLHSFTGVQDIYSASPKFGVNTCLSYHKDYFLGTAVSSNYFNNNDFSFSGYPGNTDYPFQFVFGSYSALPRGLVDPEQKYLMFWTSGGNSVDAFSGMYVSKFFVLKHDSLMFYAGSGVKFYADQLYKPIIEDGIVVDFSNDMTKESELDDWDGSSQHRIVDPTPPTPSGDDDDMDVMNTGATGSSGGFTHFYIMSPQDLIDLLSDFYTRADAGETLSNNLVCSYILGIPSSAWASTESVPVAIHNSAQGTPFVSNDNYNHVTATNNMLVTGTFDVPRMTNTFYDFSPYSTYEVFIPCCGWVRLPDTVAGRTINVYLYLDIASCCVKGQVMISGAGVCAVVNGALGSPIPMAVIESGILRGNNIQAGMGMIGGAIQTGVSAGSGNAMGVGLGAERILTGLVNCSVAGNTNYTEQKGGTGDITQFAMGHQCYMKITHPVIDPVVNNTEFGHTVGYLCNSIGQLNSFHGFTVCTNPHVHISATDTEKEEIKQLLEQGVILP